MSQGTAAAAAALAVQGFLRRDRQAIHQACLIDPLASASVGLDSIRAMVDELFEANARWLDGWEAAAPSAVGAESSQAASRADLEAAAAG